MATIVRDLRSFCRPNSKTLRPVDLRLVLESAINMAMNELKDRARIVRDYSPVPAVVADGARLGQVFLNLLAQRRTSDVRERPCPKSKTRSASPSGPDGDRIRVEITDSGHGIAPDIIGRVFEPFFTTKPVGIGTGLGLSISQTIVTSMQGELTVRERARPGATFAVLLPLPQEVPVGEIEDERPAPDALRPHRAPARCRR